MAKKNTYKKKPLFDEPRINGEITCKGTVRVVFKSRENEQESFNQVMSIDAARSEAASRSLDLIEINPSTTPPILRIDNYSKYLFEQKKRVKENKKPSQQVKEIQLSTNISEHDMETKAKMAERFLSEGDKVKVVLKMRGRELGRREQSKKSILLFMDRLADVSLPESMPRDEGNKCIVILKKK